jgi:hypothetical protein
MEPITRLLLFQRRSPSSRDAGSWSQAAVRAFAFLSERGDPIATHGFENLGQGRSTTPGPTQIVMTLNIQGQGGSLGPAFDHVKQVASHLDHRRFPKRRKSGQKLGTGMKHLTMLFA